jgi:hypothetical protein
MRLIIIFIAIFGYIGIGHAQTGPLVQVEDSNIDLKTLTEGDTASHTFTIKNVGNETLIINDVEVTCACLRTELSSTSVSVGNEETITVWFNTEGKMGRQHKIVSLKTNAIVPVTRLSIMAEVVPSD